jgi:hypothetical protein
VTRRTSGYTNFELPSRPGLCGRAQTFARFSCGSDRPARSAAFRSSRNSIWVYRRRSERPEQHVFSALAMRSFIRTTRHQESDFLGPRRIGATGDWEAALDKIFSDRWAQLNSVFVTAESANKSVREPDRKRILFAFLRDKPRHP